METYTLLREIADSWVLLAMFLFFIGAGIWAFLPSQSGARTDASMIPFRNEKTPSDTRKDGCEGSATKSRAPFDLKGQADG